MPLDCPTNRELRIQKMTTLNAEPAESAEETNRCFLREFCDFCVDRRGKNCNVAFLRCSFAGRIPTFMSATQFASMALMKDRLNGLTEQIIGGHGLWIPHRPPDREACHRRGEVD